MNSILRLALLTGSLFIFYIIIQRIRKSKIQMRDSIFWVLFALLLILNALFPMMARWFATLFGFIATSNFIFSLVIAILLVKEFSNAMEISMLRHKIEQLTQDQALHQKEFEELKEKLK